MVWLAIIGIVLDLVRLGFYTQENHTKYFDYGMPSTYPARFAFLFAAICLLYLIRQGDGRVVRGRKVLPLSLYQQFAPWCLYLLGFPSLYYDFSYCI